MYNGHGDEQMRARAHRLGRRIRARRRVGGDDPDVADVVAIARIASGSGPSMFGVNSPPWSDLPDELDVVVFERRRVFLEAPAGIDRSQVEIVGRARLAVGPVAEAAGLELLRANRERRRRRAAPCRPAARP